MLTLSLICEAAINFSQKLPLFSHALKLRQQIAKENLSDLDVLRVRIARVLLGNPLVNLPHLAAEGRLEVQPSIMPEKLVVQYLLRYNILLRPFLRSGPRL